MKWSHSRCSRMVVVRPDDQGTSPLTGWMSFHDLPPPSSSSSSPGGLSEGGGPTRHSHRFIPRGIVGASSRCPISDCWDFACRALAFATTNIKPFSPHATPVLVHRCAAVAAHCPASLLEWIVAYPRGGAGGDDGGDAAGRWFPGGAACAATADDLGRLPLHRALEAADASPSSSFEEDAARDDRHGAEEDVRSRAGGAASYGDPRLQRNRARIIKTLLRWHPRAAAMPFPDGRLPLVHAVVRGGSWHTADFHNGNVGLLQLLWTHSPEQSLEVDPLSGLYPFMLAATVPAGRHNRNAHEVVENVYNLLRKDPQLVSGALLADDVV
jgi:hypothetical protein